jgi:hypothetical protein
MAPAVTRSGTGLADGGSAADPLVFAAPASVSFGCLPRPGGATARVLLSDAGGGAGQWSVAVDPISDPKVTVTALPAVTVPGTLQLSATVVADAAPAAHMGVVRLTRGGEVRRIAFWLRVSARQLASEPSTALRRPGVYVGDTAGRSSRVPQYRYPEVGAFMRGPEQVFRVKLSRRAANFGVAVLSRARDVAVEPRITAAGDEDRLQGFGALPGDVNPYRSQFGEIRLVAGALLPQPGSYDVVFDSRTRSGAGAFTFRFWVNDTSPPSLRALARSVARGAPLRVAGSDGVGSGVDPASISARVDGRRRPASFRGGVISVGTTGLPAGSHILVLSVADFQETKNNENASRILPNTRTVRLSFRVTG